MSKGKAIGVAVGTAIAIATPFIAGWEGKANDPYIDLAKIQTVCYGETSVTMRRYTDAECMEMLKRRVERDFAPAVLTCVPGLQGQPEITAASISLAYNIGTSAFCRSTVARRFNAGDWRGGCEGFGAWVYVQGRRVQGLVNRRRDETQLCMRGV